MVFLLFIFTFASPVTLYAKANSASATTEISLPASFTGTTPCADCPGIKQTLTLRPDGLYFLQRQYLGKKKRLSLEHGVWRVDASGTKLTLHNGDAVTQQFVVTSAGRLQLLHQSAESNDTNIHVVLSRAARVEPMNKESQWRGEFQFTEGTPVFTDCVSGLHWSVGKGAEIAHLKNKYSEENKPLLIHFSGKLVKFSAKAGSPQEEIVIEKIASVENGVSCVKNSIEKTNTKTISGSKNPTVGGTFGSTNLAGADWKLIKLNGNEINMPSTRMQSIRIKFFTSDSRILGNGGCNQISGHYELEGSSLHITKMSNLMRACETPFMDMESQILKKILEAVTAYRIEDKHLVFLIGDRVLARFEAIEKN